MDLLWHDVGHSFLWVWVWVGACQRIPLSVLARNPYNGLAHEIFLGDQKKTREGKVPWQSTEESSQKKSGKGDGQRKTAAKRSAGTCGLRSQVSKRERMSQRSWWLCVNFAQIHAHNSPQKATGANSSPYLFVLLFFHPFGCVCCILCVCKAM